MNRSSNDFKFRIWFSFYLSVYLYIFLNIMIPCCCGTHVLDI